MVAKIAARVTAPPVPFADVQQRMRDGGDLEYLHVVVTGRFHHDKERYLYAPGKSGLAWQVLTPLEWAPERIVWVNRGLVPDARRAPESRADGQVPGIVSVAGLLRRPQAGAFTPRNDVAHNIWYFADAG
ncbi:SURF1 family protein, partial [Herbaspirillum sp. HC18]